MTDNEQNQNTAPQDEVMPSLTTTDTLPPLPAQKDAPPAENNNRQRTKLHEVVHEAWGVHWLDDDAFESIIKYADPEMARKTKTGFEVGLLNGGKISWEAPSQENPNERISCASKKFDQEAAAGMVSLARLRGWKTINVNGTVPQKEMLWLAVMRQDLVEKDLFLKRQKDGTIPKTDKDGKPIVYQPLTVANYMPLADSKIYQQWLVEKAAWDAAHPEEIAPAEVTKAAAPATPAPEKKETPAEEAKKTEPDTKTEATTKKTPINSKFMNTPNYKPESKDPKDFKANGKPKHQHPKGKQRGGPKPGHK